MEPLYPNKKVKEDKILVQNVKVLNPVKEISSIESGMNPASDNEKSKRKIVKGVAPFL